MVGAQKGSERLLRAGLEPRNKQSQVEEDGRSRAKETVGVGSIHAPSKGNRKCLTLSRVSM